MKILFTKKFSKDLDAIQYDSNVKKRMLELIEKIKQAETLSEISGIKKIEGYSS